MCKKAKTERIGAFRVLPFAIITIVLTVSVNSPLSSPCSEGTDPYSLDEIEKKAEQHTSDDDMESPFVAQYVCYYRVIIKTVYYSVQ